MKRLLPIILILCSISMGCKPSKDMKLYFVKIAPIGISDFPRDTLFIALKKSNALMDTSSTKNELFTRKITTDEKTLSEIVSFIDENRYKSTTKDNFEEYGCFNISVYNKNDLITNYNLNRLTSKRYLNYLILMMDKNDLDNKVIKQLKDECLRPIDY